jgi:integrase
MQYIHAVTRNALRNTECEELITRNVQIATPRYNVGKGLLVIDIKRLLSAAKGTRFYPIYVLAATLGLRRGELLGLRWSDIYFGLRRESAAELLWLVGAAGFEPATSRL